ncbi:hypothetical protein FXO38_15183 [Capsicum annuum]|uniref:Uncharacterized protein n=1 Tax=Capsicum annuum TaxID=4072 RepID=A0A2G2Y5H0_CAPAN|nr:hypothetical protein FXO37_28166 [Capsicum annuum]KAF3654393.1 hypothetical protein FXO38_15183 [Capsicum annuum]PHT65006.1 hypothetical protein T459_29431 [Capsicum annuum]
MNRDEDLVLFRDMYKREKNDLASLLLPVPDEFEANGNYALYRMASTKKGQVGLDYYLMSNETGKNDYDWLKTPPATPLFPSLDMEANDPELVIQKEIPIIQPVVTLSRFTDKTGAAKTRSTLTRSASPNTKPKQIVKQSASSIEKKNTRFSATTTITMIKSNTSNDNKERSNTLPSNATRTTKQKDASLNFLASNLSKTLGMESSLNTTRPKSRGVSPAGRPKILGAQFPGFSNETPTNLRTDRSLSANRGRPNQSTNQRPVSSSSSSSSTSSSLPSTKPMRRQSCSPSVTRGRQQEISTTSTKPQHGNGTTQVLGSKMVDKFLNARKSIHEEKDINKTKLNGSMNESPGFGRHISRISANLAHKHMEIHQDSGNSGKNGTTTGRKSSNIRGSRIPSA